jgi:uncharacterized protein (DUF1499 family)
VDELQGRSGYGGLWRLVALGTLGSALLVALAGPLTRFGVADWQAALGLMRYAAIAAGIGALLCLIGTVVLRLKGRRIGLLALGLVAGAAAFAVPVTMLRMARSVPPIHDISTDTQDPPGFVALLPDRAGAANPPGYAGADVAAQQRQAYPDVAPIMLRVPPAQAFGRARAAAADLGWRVAAADPAAGRIEATATTLWFGFKDDVVIRLRPAGGGTRVDVRSKSRVGKSDLGANAARIRAFAARLNG